MSKEFIYKVTKFYETAELPDNCFGGQVKWAKDTSEPETVQQWTQENYDNALSYDTLKYFRKVFNSRQVLKTKTDKKTGKETTILYSYAPNSLTYRSTFIIEGI